MSVPRGRLRRAVVALSAGVVSVVGTYAATGRWSASLVAAVESVVVDTTPAVVVTTAITTLGDGAELLALATAVALSVALLAVPVGAALSALDRGVVRTGSAVLLSALGVAVVAWAVGGALLAGVGAGLGAGAMALLYASDGERTGPSASRRWFVRVLGGVFALGGGGVLVGDRSSTVPSATSESLPTGETAARDRLAAAAEKSLDVDGLPPLVSSTDDFYEVDINTLNPTVDADSWELALTGEVVRERTWSLSDLSSLPVDQRFVTLRCVSDPLNGEKMDNALWTGVPADALLDGAGVAGTHVVLRAVDGYYNEFPLEALRDGLFAYRMNGEPLPRNHGAPVRALIPGHWGEINVKWVTEIEVVDHEVEGYWEKRGWHGTGPVNTVAKLWTRNRLSDGRMQVGGCAYAGTRGVGAVEVSVDGGETWADARLSEPLPGDDVWRQWAHEWTPTRSRHEVVVRAVESDGTVQSKTRDRAPPDGATGWVSDVVVV
ncbi:MAG: molybdopterin-dependent oxidoreductase [Haloglomus sp.]